MKSWLAQGSSGRRVTLLPGTTFLHINGALSCSNEQAESCNKINVESPTDSEIVDAFLAARNLKITFNTKSKLVSSILYSK